MSKSLPQIFNLMRLPGCGLLTLSAGSDRAKKFLQKHRIKDSEWGLKIYSSVRNSHRPLLIGVPSDAGGGILRGAAHGPLHIREALYKRKPIMARFDLGDIPCIPQLSHDSILNSSTKAECGKTLWGRNYKTKSPVSPLNLTEELIYQCFKVNSLFQPIVLGGDHSVSDGIMGGLKKAGQLKNAAILHFDAHPDMIASRFGIEHCFTTWAYNALDGIKNPAQFAQIGIRQTLKPKNYWEKKHGIKQIWAKECLRKSAQSVFNELHKNWTQLKCEKLYLSFDIDALDISLAPATGTPSSNGLNLNFCRELIKLCLKEWPLLGMDLVEVAPTLGSTSSHKRTLNSAMSILETVLPL